MPTLKIQRTDPRAIMPKRGTKDSACFDLFAMEDVEIKPGEWKRFSTGLIAQIPNDYVLLVFSRSGQGFNNQVTLVNGTGVIDQDYGGVIMVGLRNDGDETYFQPRGKAIAQAMLIYRPFTVLEEVEEAHVEGERGANGFGSTDNVAKGSPIMTSRHLK